MPLPDAQTPWPPPGMRDTLARIAEHDAWYSGDPARLHKHYRTAIEQPDVRPSQLRGGVVGAIARMWYGKPRTPSTPPRVHVPAAGDLATANADLLFGEPPTLTSRPAKASGVDGTPDRLDQITTNNGLRARLTEAAEVTSALGGVFLRVWWDRDIAGVPMVQAMHADTAAPEIVGGVLRAVTYVTEVARSGPVVRRHLERHEPGAILHGLYEGTDTNLGRPVPLTDDPATARLSEQVTVPGQLLASAYVPNMLPNPANRGSWLGRSDYHRSESLFDWLDETMTSWRRDIQYGKGRLIVPDGYLSTNGPGQGATFDIDRGIYQPLSIPQTALGGGSSPITVAQFAIRVAEHRDTAREILARIVANAGYSARTFGLDEQGGPVTATEVRVTERRTYTTRDKKLGYWTPALEHIGLVLLAVDRAEFAGPGAAGPVKVRWPDGVTVDLLTLAQTVQAMRTADAASDDTLVRTLHPDWDDPRVAAEVAAIGRERAAREPVLPDPGASLPA